MIIRNSSGTAPVQGRTKTIDKTGPPHAMLKGIIYDCNGHHFQAAGNRSNDNHSS